MVATSVAVATPSTTADRITIGSPSPGTRYREQLQLRGGVKTLGQTHIFATGLHEHHDGERYETDPPPAATRR